MAFYFLYVHLHRYHLRLFRLFLQILTLMFSAVAANCAAACSPAGSTGLTTSRVLTSNQQLIGTTVNAAV